MRIRDVLWYALSHMKKKKKRSFLTMLGVLIGIAAIVSITSLGNGFQVTFTRELENSLGVNTLTVTTTSFGGPSGSRQTYDTILYAEDADYIRNIDDVKAATAVKSVTGDVHIDNISYTLTIQGVNISEYAKIYESTFKTYSGSFENLENDSVVVGYNVAFPYGNETQAIHDEDNLTVTLTYRSGVQFITRNFTFTVVAILQQAGGFSQQDTALFVPLETVLDIYNITEVSYIVVSVESSDKIDSVKEKIKEYYHDEIAVNSSEALLSTMESMFSIMVLFVSAIAAVALIVAGVGIMNIMTVSVTERTREIGILKSLGAKDRTILGIFLAEAAVIGFLGGIAGIIFGLITANILGSQLFAMFSSGFSSSGGTRTLTTNTSLVITPIFDPLTGVMSLLLAVGLSIIFALQPAYNASKKDPVQALLYF